MLTDIVKFSCFNFRVEKQRVALQDKIQAEAAKKEKETAPVATATVGSGQSAAQIKVLFAILV